MSMVSVCLPSDALLQHLSSYLGFSYLGCAVSLHGCSSKAQPLLLTFDEVYLLTAILPNLQCGRDPLGPPAPVQPLLLGHGVLEDLNRKIFHVHVWKRKYFLNVISPKSGLWIHCTQEVFLRTYLVLNRHGKYMWKNP